MASFSDLISVKAQATWFAELRTKLKDVYKVPVEAWVSVVNTGLALSQVISDGLEQVGAQVTGVLRALTFETSAGVGLSVFGKSQYQLPRLESSFALGQVVLTCIGAGPYTLAAGDVTVGTPGAGGKLYTSTSGGVLNPSVPLTILGVDANGGVTYSARTTGVRIAQVNNGVSKPLLVTVAPGTRDVTVQLATDIATAITSTAADVAGAVAANAEAAALLAAAATGTGGGLAFVQPLSPLTVGQLVVDVQALEPGVTSNVANGSISEMKTPLAGVTVSNPAIGTTGTWITSPGTDGEPETDQGDAQYKRRLLLRWAVVGELVTDPATGVITVVTASATQSAYEFWARFPVSGGKTSPVTKAKILSNWKDGAPLAQAVTVLVAGPAGALAAGDIAAVAANFENPRRYPLLDKLFVATVVPVTVTLTGTVNVLAPYSIDDVKSQVAVALAKLQADIQIGATVYRTELLGTVQKANDAAIRDVVLTGPVGDTVVAFNGLVTIQNNLTYQQV